MQQECAQAVEQPIAYAVRTAWRRGSRLPGHSPAPEGLQQKDHRKDGHTIGQLNLLKQNNEMMPRLRVGGSKQKKWVNPYLLRISIFASNHFTKICIQGIKHLFHITFYNKSDSLQIHIYIHPSVVFALRPHRLRTQQK